VQPVNTSRFFHHSTVVGSRDPLCKLIQSHDAADEFGLQPDGYGALLRPGSFTFLLVVTDERVDCSQDGVLYRDASTVSQGEAVAAAFENQLFTKWPAEFGADAAGRRYSLGGALQSERDEALW
jgi:hypothetical protein